MSSACAGRSFLVHVVYCCDCELYYLHAVDVLCKQRPFRWLVFVAYGLSETKEIDSVYCFVCSLAEGVMARGAAGVVVERVLYLHRHHQYQASGEPLLQYPLFTV